MEGVQYHPESIASEQGLRLFANFLSWNSGKWEGLETRWDLVALPTNNPSMSAAGVSSSDKSSSNIPGYKQNGTGGIPLSTVSKLNSTSSSSNDNSPGHSANTSSKSTISSSASNTATAQPPSILKKIYAQRKIDSSFAQTQPGRSLSHLQKSISLGLAPSLVDIISRIRSHATPPPSILAEIKRASPSKGGIDLKAHAPSQALLYAAAGVAAISVLTEPHHFKGSLEDLMGARAALSSMSPSDRPALLRKDFIVDAYMIHEARLAGADSVLLIVGMLEDDKDLGELVEVSRALGMEPLVEVASENEMKRALSMYFFIYSSLYI
jgi:anthranilate synthase / indole-3-glycerol phosphate synthase / phosphoribosylanthranilate isomerase